MRSSIADDRLEAELVDVTETINRLHRDLSALRRKIRDIMPHGGHSLADYDSWARAYYARLRTAVDYERTRTPLPDSPRVSVLCPVYKSILTDFIQAVQSVMAQTYPHWELIFIDDGRADATISHKIDTFCAADKRMRVITLPKNQGIAGATNTGLMEAKGDYIAFFDHDDVLADVALEVMVRAALRTHAQFLYSDEDKIDLHGCFRDPNLKPDFSYRYLLGCNYICHLTMHAALARKIGLLDGTYKRARP
ncbi:MAG: glycosyltransferase [Acetobacteraceae bacterium]